MEPDGTESGGRAGVPPERALDRARPSVAATAQARRTDSELAGLR